MIKNLIPSIGQVREFLIEKNSNFKFKAIETFIVDQDEFYVAIAIESPYGNIARFDHRNSIYAEILKIPTTFWHAWQMMKKVAIFKCLNKYGEDEPGIYTVIDDVLHTKFEHHWVRLDITDNLTSGRWFFTGEMRQLGE